MKNHTNYANLITAILGFLKPNQSGQDRRNLRLAKRMYKKLRKDFKKDGLDKQEIDMLHSLKKSIVKRTIELGN